MKKICLSFCLALMAAAAARAQDLTVDQGKAEELKGITRIYVSTDDDSHPRIIKEIARNLPGLTFTDKPEEAEVWLLFNVQRRTNPKGDPTSALTASGVSTVASEYEYVASGSAVIPVARNRVRKLLDFKDEGQPSLKNNLSANFARAFIKAYRKANEGAKKE